MNRQKGMSLIGLLLSGATFAFLFLLGMKVVPAVAEYYAVKKVMSAIVSSVDSSSVTVAEVRKSFDTRRVVDEISSVTGADLEVTKQSGKVVIAVAYARKIPVIANVSLVIDFEASTGN